jgi:hypothetical protein
MAITSAGSPQAIARQKLERLAMKNVRWSAASGVCVESGLAVVIACQQVKIPGSHLTPCLFGQPALLKKSLGEARPCWSSSSNRHRGWRSLGYLEQSLAANETLFAKARFPWLYRAFAKALHAEGRPKQIGVCARGGKQRRPRTCHRPDGDLLDLASA